MRRIRHLAALAGSAAAIAAGALALASPVSAASASAEHPAVITPQLDDTSIVLNKVETDGADNVITFGDETDISVVAHLNPTHNDTPLGTANIDATNQADSQETHVCDITSWNASSHFGDCGAFANNTLTPGTYNFRAVFLGTPNVLKPSVSNNVTVTVNPENSTLSAIPAGSLTMTYGSETADSFPFTVSPQFANTGTAPSGTVSAFVAAGGGLCDATLDNNGSGSCSLQSDIALNAGTDTIGAFYGGDGNYNGDFASDEGAGEKTLTILPEASGTNLVVSSDVKSGNSGALTATVSPTTKGTPTGVVDFVVDGQTICNQMAIGANQTAVCPSNSLSPGSHTITAHYEGDTNFSASDSSQTFNVTAPAAVSLTVSTPLAGSKATYGREQGVHLNVNVTSAAAGTPSGMVSVFAGSNRLCTITLNSAAGQCRLSPAKLKPGSYHLTASYSGDTNFTSATTPPGQAQALTITREPAITALAPLKIKTVTVGHENREHLTVTVKPKFAGVTPTGKVTFKATRKGGSVTTLCRNVTLVNGKARCTIGARKLRRGTYRLIATYGGSGIYTGSTSPISSRDTLTVR